MTLNNDAWQQDDIIRLKIIVNHSTRMVMKNHPIRQKEGEEGYKCINKIVSSLDEMKHYIDTH